MLVIISAVTTNAPDNHADNDDSDQENRAAPAHPFYEQRQAGSEQVAQRGDYDRPEDGAGGRNQHHQRETEYSRRAEIAGDEENGFTGHGQPGIFEHHAKEDCPITVCEHVLLDQLQGIMEKIHRATLQESLWRY